MERQILFCIFLYLSLVCRPVCSQEFNYKYGKVSKAEIEMQSYAPDTSAVAVVLSKRGDTRYDYVGNTFVLVSSFEVRIKILKDEGKKYGDIAIPFYYNISNNVRDQITGIKATVYNSEGGKIIESDLKKNYIFEEKSSENWRMMKFSAPNVRKGSVLEYKYTLRSEAIYNIDPWTIQDEIPVNYACYEIEIPEYFVFNKESRGYVPINAKTELTGTTYTISLGGGQTENVQVNCQKYIFTSQNVPALKDEPFVWCKKDFSSAMTFELSGIKLPYSAFKSYTQTWDDICKLLKDHGRFGSYLKMKNPLAAEMKQLTLDSLDTKDRLRSLFSLLKKWVKWNGNYDLLGTNPSKSLKEGKGSNADINFILLSMLRDADITATPVLLRNRDMGRLPITHPSLEKLSTFIVAVSDPDGKTFYVDGSVENGDVDVLPPSLMVWKAIVYDGAESVVDLTKVGNSFINRVIKASVKPDGSISGSQMSAFHGVSSMDYKTDYAAMKDSSDLIKKIEARNNITVTSFRTEAAKGLSERCLENFEFTGNLLTNGDLIYVNPMIFPEETKNPFTSIERKFPVEFSYPQIIRMDVSLQIPEGYVVEELPKSMRLMLDKNLSVAYMVQQDDMTLRTTYLFMMKDVLFLADKYDQLRTFWEQLVEKNNIQIVLKRNVPKL